MMTPHSHIHERPMPQKNCQHLRIATRQSPLALWQAYYARDKLLEHWPSLSIELLPMTTSGDRFADKKLLEIGGKGLFVKELEEALLDGRADLAVHSMKDVPAVCPEGLVLDTIFARQTPTDAFVSNQYPSLACLPQGAVVGTSSLRRASQLLALRPDLTIKPIRGNVGTRLKKLDTEDYDAIILAAAGLERLGLEARIQETLPSSIMLPSPGQGALGIECRANDTALQQLLEPLHDAHSALCVQAERTVNAMLGGTCHTPVAVYCREAHHKNKLTLDALVASADGATIIRDTQVGTPQEILQLAERSAHSMLSKGAAALLLHA